MNSEQQERIPTILSLLDKAYDSSQTLLDYQTPFQLLIAVALSAQTTDNQVNRVTPELFRWYPDSKSLAQAELKKVEEIIHSTGFYKNKAKNSIAAAKRLEESFDGQVPDTMEALVQIPGIGRKSAGVILHHIYHKPAVIVDTHFGRVVYRLGFTTSKDPLKIEQDISKIIPERAWSNFSMTANLHGRAICKAHKPNCLGCFLLPYCNQTGVPLS